MVETLLSLILLMAAVILALRPSLGIHDHTIDRLFLTVTGSMLSTMFLIISSGNCAIKVQMNSLS